jgi:hypothetical protein
MRCRVQALVHKSSRLSRSDADAGRPPTWALTLESACRASMCSAPIISDHVGGAGAGRQGRQAVHGGAAVVGDSAQQRHARRLVGQQRLDRRARLGRRRRGRPARPGRHHHALGRPRAALQLPRAALQCARPARALAQDGAAGGETEAVGRPPSRMRGERARSSKPQCSQRRQQRRACGLSESRGGRRWTPTTSGWRRATTAA